MAVTDSDMAGVKRMIVEYGKYYVTSLTDYKVATIIAAMIEDNYLGVTKDSQKIDVEPNIINYDFNGTYGLGAVGFSNIRGMKKAECSGKVCELSDKYMDLSLWEKQTGESGDTYEIWKPIKNVSKESYKDVILAGQTQTGESIIFVFKHAFNTKSFSLEMKEKENAAAELSVEAHMTKDEIYNNDCPVLVLTPKATT